MMRDELVEELAQARKKPVTQRDRKAIREELMDELIERSKHLGFVAGDYFGDGATLLQHDRSDSTWPSVAEYLTTEKAIIS